MASKVLGIWAEKDADFAAEIEGCMKRERIGCKTMAKKALVSYTTHRKRINLPDTMTVSELRRYVNILNIPEEKLLDFIYRSRDKK